MRGAVFSEHWTSECLGIHVTARDNRLATLQDAFEFFQRYDLKWRVQWTVSERPTRYAPMCQAGGSENMGLLHFITLSET